MAVEPADGGALLEVWVQPRASRDGVAGFHGERLKVRVAAPPVDGEANEALTRFLAKALGVPRSAVTIVRGHTGRHKSVRVTGLTPEEVRARLGL